MRSFKIIQGGMGVGVSGWPLAKAVSMLGQMGVVSGTALAVVLARRLQQGDPQGHVRRAMAHFPVPDVANRVLGKYYVPGGKAGAATYFPTPVPQLTTSAAGIELTVLANFVEVFLAKEGHAGAVGINFLETIQIPALASIFGAMLAGVDCVLMGAGIPRYIPHVLDAFSRGESADLGVNVEHAVADDAFATHFDPAAFCGGKAPMLKRPDFLAIVSSYTLALTLARKCTGKVDGFIIEGATAGGHNAPPRGPAVLSDRGEPVYGPRDAVNLAQFRELGLPFWLAGGFAHPGRLAEALAEGAQGIQVGTAFAFCDESGIEAELKARVLAATRAGLAPVFTDPRASPTGYPFKVVQLKGTLPETSVYDARHRVCDLGYLRHPYRRPDGSVGYRCPAEPEEQYTRKDGLDADTIGRKCICNALLATIGFGQVRPDGECEAALVTAGDDLSQVTGFLKPGKDSYTAAEVISYILGTQPGGV